MILLRLWAFVCGVPLGLLAALASLPQAGPLHLAGAALAGGALLSVAASLLARVRDDETERPHHLAAAVGWSWLAVPAGGAVLYGFAPGGLALLVLVTGALGVVLALRARAMGPGPGSLGWALRAAAAVVLGGAALTGLAAAVASLGAETPDVPARWSNAAYDVDARVATVALPTCGDAETRVTPLLSRGAHPALSPDGATLWFDAEVAGRRQIHRLERASGAVDCWTCDEPGDNARPSAGDSGNSIAFDTNRHATWRWPDDTEVHLMSARAGKRPPTSRRVTFDRGPDDHAILGPGSRLVVWSRRVDGRYRVVAASMQTGHGGLLLGNQSVLVSGGASWVAPAAWSRDARTLVVVRGNPFGPLEGVAIDPATGARSALGGDRARASAFNADGGWTAAAITRGGHAAGLLPDFLGFALAPFATKASLRAPLRGTTGLVAGPSPGPGRPLELPDGVARWGSPTGLALDPGGTTGVLGQRREGPSGTEERLLELAFDCGETRLARDE